MVNTKKEKKTYLEALRIISAFFVIFTHLPSASYFLDAHGISRFIAIVISIISRISVPVFFMISGALLLDKQEDYKTIIKKRFLRICGVIFIFELGMFILAYLYFNVYKHIPFEGSFIKTFIKGALTGTLDNLGSYWFLYIYLAFVLSLPFMRIIAPKIEEKDIKFILITHFCFVTLLPILNFVLRLVGFGDVSYNSGFDVPFANKMIFLYPFIGYYIDKKIDVKKFGKKELLLWTYIFLGCLSITILMIYLEAKIKGGFSVTYAGIFDYAFATLIFVIFKYLFEVKLPNKKYWNKISRIICFIGPLTFGMYLLDPYLGILLTGRFHTLLIPYMSTFVIGLLWSPMSMFICGMITFILKKMPIFKKLI